MLIDKNNYDSFNKFFIYIPFFKHKKVILLMIHDKITFNYTQKCLPTTVSLTLSLLRMWLVTSNKVLVELSVTLSTLSLATGSLLITFLQFGPIPTKPTESSTF